MKKIKLTKKLSLNKENVSTLNSIEQMNAKGGKVGPEKTKDKTGCIIICVTLGGCGHGTLGCVCGDSLVKTCGIYCPPDATDA